MLFNSLHYFAFVVVVVPVVLWLRGKPLPRNVVLVAASYYFYGMWDWRFLGLIVMSTVVDYGCALTLGERTSARERNKVDKAILAVSIVVNLGVLGFFKYYNFFYQSIVNTAAGLGLEVGGSALQVVLPVGISFYTFQTLGYTVDVYRGECSPERDFTTFAAYVAFFPQLVAGPIERASRLIPQLSREFIVKKKDINAGAHLICVGLFKKVVVADNAARVADAVFSRQGPTGMAVLLGTYAFAAQIYGDFSGYTDIARGTARLFGIKLMENFRLPYFATNPADFWRRWHISLSTWLRDYVYISLGGSRVGGRRMYSNLMATMALGGLWHGASWTFVIWGVYHGALLCIHRASRPVWAWFGSGLSDGAWYWLRVVAVFHLTCIGWLFFRAGTLGEAWNMLGLLGTNPGLLDPDVGRFHVLVTVSCVGGVGLLHWLRLRSDSDDIVWNTPGPVRGLLYAMGTVVFVLFGRYTGAPFIYFQF